MGEIDRVGTKDGEPVLVVGIGGFLGIGEHSVAMNLDELSYDQEEAAFIVQGYSEEQLKDLPEYSEEQIAFLDNDQTLSTAWTSGMAASGTMMDDTNADHSDMAAADTMTMDETDAEASDMAAAESTMMEDTDTAESTDLTQEAQDALDIDMAEDAPAIAVTPIPLRMSKNRCRWTPSSTIGRNMPISRTFR